LGIPEELFKGVDLKIRNRELTLATKLPLFVEHPHVYTLGKSDLSNLLLSEKQLEEKDATFYKIVVEISRTMDQVKL
jgi:lipoyl(octanoyl) transferase